jgi:MerR family transcriptional regulator, thiopeptide resistance regulator
MSIIKRGKRVAWKIGEVIGRTGLTARALHFYEEQGLIGPIPRSASGHRLYDQSDLLRLQQIRTLRQLGVSLADMPPLLSDTGQLVPQLKQQLTKLNQQRQTIQSIESKITKLVDVLETRSIPQDDLDEILFQTLESMTMYDKYFNQSEIDAMHNREHIAGSGESFESAWNGWVSNMQSAHSNGADPKSREVQDLMHHWNEMITQLTENDDEKLKAFNDLLHNEPQARKDHGISDELFEFMAQASGGH